MDEIKNKIKNVINKPILTKQVKVPEMGFSEYFIQHVSLVPETYNSTKNKNKVDDDEEQRCLDSDDPSLAKHKLPDEEILESIDAVYYHEDTVAGLYELKRLTEDGDDFHLENIDRNMKVLRQQQKVISKKVLQLILDQRTACTTEFNDIDETQKKLQESMWTCQKARSYLNYAKQQLTTSSLEILAAYRKREIILNLLEILRTLKQIKMADQTFQQLIQRGEYSAAIKCLLDTKTQTETYKQYHCIESFTQKIQDTLIMTEVQLDDVLNSLTVEFDAKKYTKLQEAFMLLGKAPIAMDQLHMNFISSIHSTAFSVLKGYVVVAAQNATSPATPQKLVFEQLCENIPADRYIDCLINLCKSFWKILVCYHQIVLWHQHNPLTSTTTTTQETANNDEISHDEYVHQKLKKGQFRIWNDIQAKICLYINSSRIHQLKYEHFIQALSIMQRLKKVGLEFCDEPSEKLMETIRTQSVEFFQRYHRSCLEEIALFVDHEAWVQITSFVSVSQLQEYKTVKRALQRHQFEPSSAIKDENKILPLLSNGSGNGNKNSDNDSVSHEDESSIYGSCGYFLRFSEKSSPFDGGFDETMLEEDILAGIADESSCYYSEDSDDCEAQQDGSLKDVESQLIINNTSLTVLRCIGRYLQMCRLLYSISPQIVLCMTELIDYFICAVHEMFTKDLTVPGENLYTPLLAKNLNRILDNIIPKVKKWPPSYQMIEHDVLDPEALYGLAKRVIAVESCVCLLEQFGQLRGYLDHLMAAAACERQTLDEYFQNADKYARDLRKPVYMCSMARVVDLQSVLTAMSKVKWDINQISSVHSAYVDAIHRAVQTFAMRLEEINAPLPKDALWDALLHVLTHTIVEGFSNAKKCSTGGRALMQLDFTHFTSLFDLISGKKFPEHNFYVEQYVKAYYMPKDLLEEFITTQTSYSSKQMIGLINCACSNDKKTRQKLLAMVDKDKSGSKENILS